MESKLNLLEWKGYATGAGTFIITLLLFYHWSGGFTYSVFGAALFAAIIWGSYLVIRLIILAFRSESE